MKQLLADTLLVGRSGARAVETIQLQRKLDFFPPLRAYDDDTHRYFPFTLPESIPYFAGTNRKHWKRIQFAISLTDVHSE